jgi:hypothetical protein
MNVILVILAIASLAYQPFLAQQYPSQGQRDQNRSQFFTQLKELGRVHPSPAMSRTDSLGAKLTLDRYEACPGEVLQLQAQVVNMSEVELKFPASPHVGRIPLLHLELHIVTPAGEEFVHRPYASLEQNLSERDFIMGIYPGKSDWVLWPNRVESSLDLVAMVHGWSQKGPDQSNPLSLRNGGQYRLWYEISLPVVKNAPENAWSGSAKSNVVRFTVSELPPEQTLKEPTREQLLVLDEYVKGADKVRPGETDPRYEQIKEALQLSRNEGLALEVLRLLKQHVPEEKSAWYQNLLVALVQRAHRAFQDGPLRIDGPYLRELTAFFLQRLKQAFMSEEMPPAVDLAAILLYLKSHPEDHELRLEAIALARKNASPGGLTEDHHLAHAKLEYAWGVLIAAGMLREGVSLQEAVAILGLPGHVYGDQSKEYTAEWPYQSPMHVNPVLRCSINGRQMLIACVKEIR